MLTLLKFEASWCAPCKAMNPVVDQVKADNDQLIVTRIDIDENPQERTNYNVRSIPTFVLIKQGKEISRKTGQLSVSAMKDWLDESRDL